MSEDFNKTNSTVNQQTREQLLDYVTTLVSDALHPLTNLERAEVLYRAAIPTTTPSEIAVMITKAIREQASKIIADQISDPSSAVSRSLKKTFGTRKVY
jgi:hypothetical protein